MEVGRRGVELSSDACQGCSPTPLVHVTRKESKATKMMKSSILLFCMSRYNALAAHAE